MQKLASLAVNGVIASANKQIVLRRQNSATYFLVNIHQKIGDVNGLKPNGLGGGPFREASLGAGCFVGLEDATLHALVHHAVDLVESLSDGRFILTLKRCVESTNSGMDA